MKKNLTKILCVATCATLLTGCSSLVSSEDHSSNYRAGSSLEEVNAGYDTFGRKINTEPTRTPAPMAESKPAAPAAKPAASSSSAYFPSGNECGSGILLQKIAPAEVIAGQPFEYSHRVINLTSATLENVVVSDRVTSNFTATDSQPKATAVQDGNATWKLGTLGPKETKTIVVRGASAEEGMVTTCGVATYNPVACQDIRVVKANIALTKTAPADATLCDSIPATITVKNTGSSTLTGVQITDMLPSGLTSEGKQNLAFNIGNLAPGESREVKYVAAASTTGKLVNTAKVTSTQGVTAQASATTMVHQPVLAVTCKAMDQQFMGRKFDVCYTVANTGDAAAAGTVLEVAVPAGLQVVSAGAGTVANGKITYSLGTVSAGSPKNVCATFMSATGGNFAFAGTVKGACAAAASTSCSTKVVGLAAILLEKSDDPDPVAIGDTTTYTVKVTNQGSAVDNNIEVVVTIAPELTPVSSSEGTISGNTVTMPVVPSLAPKQAVTYKIVAKGVKAGDGHTSFQLKSDVLKSPITAQESTHVY